MQLVIPNRYFIACYRFGKSNTRYLSMHCNAMASAAVIGGFLDHVHAKLLVGAVRRP